MKTLKYFICTGLALLLLITPALAHSHDGDIMPIISAWAQAEVARARELDLVITDRSYIKDDYREAITRREFCELAMRYVAVQYHSTSIVGLTYDALTRKEGAPPKDVFSDGNRTENMAQYLGVSEGRGDGIFDPSGLITRQEAAVMLMRAYRAIGGALPEKASAPAFTDQAHIADWASESVAALSSWQILQGQADGSFDPEGKYTVEQSVLTFLRLYENAPVSRKNRNVTPHFTYEESLRFFTRVDDNRSAEIVVEGEIATLVESSSVGWGHSSVGWSLVYRDGGVRSIDWGVCMDVYNYPDLISPRFSEDGRTFFCTIILDRDYSWGGEVVNHKKGSYHVSMDVDTGQCRLKWEELKEGAGS